MWKTERVITLFSPQGKPTHTPTVWKMDRLQTKPQIHNAMYLVKMRYQLQKQWLAQLVEHPTEKPGAVPMWDQVPSAARDFSPRVNSQCRLSYRVCTAPCVQMHVPPSARTLKIQTLAATPSCGHTKTLHTQIGMGSAALAAAFPYPGKVIRISLKE